MANGEISSQIKKCDEFAATKHSTFSLLLFSGNYAK